MLSNFHRVASESLPSGTARMGEDQCKRHVLRDYLLLWQCEKGAYKLLQLRPCIDRPRSRRVSKKTRYAPRFMRLCVQDEGIARQCQLCLLGKAFGLSPGRECDLVGRWWCYLALRHQVGPDGGAIGLELREWHRAFCSTKSFKVLFNGSHMIRQIENFIAAL